MEEVLGATGLPLVIEGSNDPELDTEVFLRCGEAGEGERLLLGTAEAGRYRSVAAAAVAYHHAVIAQSPIDINLAKQLNILLREIGVPNDQIVIDPYTGALGYGFEYSYSVMERIRYSALKGDTDLAMPVISGAPDYAHRQGGAGGATGSARRDRGGMGILYRPLCCGERCRDPLCPPPEDRGEAEGGNPPALAGSRAQGVNAGGTQGS